MGRQQISPFFVPNWTICGFRNYLDAVSVEILESASPWLGKGSGARLMQGEQVAERHTL